MPMACVIGSLGETGCDSQAANGRFLQPFMKRNILSNWILCLAFTALSSPAATVYWDNNGNTAGAGGATPNGNWSSGVSTWGNSAGTANAAPWVDGDTAVFSAGTDATGSYIVTVQNPVTVAGLIREDGTPTVN